MPARKRGISAATLVLSDESGRMIDMPFLTIHLRSRQGQGSFLPPTRVPHWLSHAALLSCWRPLIWHRVSCRVTLAIAMRPIGGIHRYMAEPPFYRTARELLRWSVGHQRRTCAHGADGKSRPVASHRRVGTLYMRSRLGPLTRCRQPVQVEPGMLAGRDPTAWLGM